MTKLLKVLYGLILLAAGVSISVWLIGVAISHDAVHEDHELSSSRFPDYFAQLNSYYDNYENRRDHFHQTKERVFLPMDEQENCLSCHSIWPHSKDRRTRAFNNQHSRYMSCMVCHIDNQPGRPVEYEWYSFGVDNSITRKGPFGVARLADGSLSAPDNFITKIVPVVTDGSLNSRIFTPYNTPQYVDYREAVDAGSFVDEVKIRTLAEGLVGENAITCGTCHAESSSFPWETLGFSGDRLNEMEHSAVVGMVEKYDSFYFPDVFE